MIVIFVASIGVLMIITNNHSTPHPRSFYFEDELYASYNVTGSGEIVVNVSKNWSMVAIAVIYTPAYVQGGYVAFLIPSGTEIDNMSLEHKPGVKASQVNESGWSVSFFRLVGSCTIKYHIEGNSKVTIQVRYKP